MKKNLSLWRKSREILLAVLIISMLGFSCKIQAQTMTFLDFWNWTTEVFNTEKNQGDSLTSAEFNELIYTVKILATGLFIDSDEENNVNTLTLANGLKLGKDMTDCNPEKEVFYSHANYIQLF